MQLFCIYILTFYIFPNNVVWFPVDYWHIWEVYKYPSSKASEQCFHYFQCKKPNEQCRNFKFPANSSSCMHNSCIKSQWNNLMCTEAFRSRVSGIVTVTDRDL